MEVVMTPSDRSEALSGSEKSDFEEAGHPTADSRDCGFQHRDSFEPWKSNVGSGELGMSDEDELPADLRAFNSIEPARSRSSSVDDEMSTSGIMRSEGYDGVLSRGALNHTSLQWKSPSLESSDLSRWYAVDPISSEYPPIILGAPNTVGCLRGQLFLDEAEVNSLREFLTACGVADLWRLELCEDYVLAERRRQRNSVALGRQKKSSGRGSATHGPKPKCSTATARINEAEASQLRDPGAAQVPRPLPEIQKLKGNPAAFKRLPDWAKRFHRVLLSISQQEPCRNFLDETYDLAKFTAEGQSPTTAYNCYLSKIYPASAIGLRTVFSKLEQHVYTKPLEVFNDIYCVWIGAYRSSEPGSARWLQAHDASDMFLSQISHHPLKDTFIPQAVEKTPTMASTDTQQGKVSPTQNRSVETLLKKVVGSLPPPVTKTQPQLPIDDSSPPMAQQRTTPAPSGASRAANRKVAKTGSSSTQPVSDAESKEFQTLLTRLQAEQHLQLYRDFCSSAYWRETNGGEVELDVSNTSPAVFRKMISWCQRKLDAGSISRPQIPMSAIKRRAPSSPGLPKTPAKNTRLSATGQVTPRPTQVAVSASFDIPPTPTPVGGINAITPAGAACSSSSVSSSSSDSSDLTSSESEQDNR